MECSKVLQCSSFQPIHRDSQIRDEQGKEMLAVDVFAHAIMYLKKQIENTIQERLPSYVKDICYILTCPAIWSEQSKLFMKEAAKRVSSFIAGHCAT